MNKRAAFEAIDAGADRTLQAAARPAENLAELQASAAGVFWLASDSTTGRKALWHWAHGEARALTPPDWDVGSRVNGYGGGAYSCFEESVVLVEGSGQAVYRLPLHGDPAGLWWSRQGARYGGLCGDPQRRRVLAVEELGDGRQGVQRLVALSEGACEVLAEGADFYGAPALSPDGRRLAWVEWELPHMPWQRAQLCQAELGDNGRILARRSWDGGAAVSQPRFADDGALIVMSDHGGWWQPYRLDGDTACLLSDRPADHAPTPWQLGESHHLWGGQGGIVTRFENGAARVLHLDTHGNTLARYFTEATRVIGLAWVGDWLYAITQGPRHSARLERVCLNSGWQETLFSLASPVMTSPIVATGEPAMPETITAPVAGEEWVTAFVHRPAADQGIPAPLIMRVHGGPTAASYPVYDPLIHWWTQQGFAVADLNPRGSGNWGRAFRERLAGEWGRLDVEDAIAMADELVEQGIADPERLFIRGQSAGGFTVLNTLASTDRFRAGASLYGVTDAPRLARQTHRFESGYLDWLLGDDEDKRARSPRYRLDSLQAPVIFFQGAQDSVVVPEQTLAMAEALRSQGGQAEVVLFDDEGHGIRHPANRQRMIVAERDFFVAAARGRE